MKKGLVLMALAIGLTAAADDYVWRDGLADLALEGRGYAHVEEPYTRLPDRFRDVVTPAVWNLSRTTIGFAARFVTDSPDVVVRWRVRPEASVGANFTWSMYAGVDVYRRHGNEPWHHVMVGAPDWSSGRGELRADWQAGDECLVYLPVRARVLEFAIGIRRGSSFDAPKPHRLAKPIVHYGTSIVNGGAASRPGMIFPAQVGRRTDLEVVDLGFSGSGKMELPMADLVAEIEASLYVIDCEWNMGAELVRTSYEPFVRRLKALRPDTPVLLCGACTERDAPRASEVEARKILARLRAEDPAKWSNWHYLSGVGMLPIDSDCTYDHCHPNDYGFVQMGRVYAETIERILAPAPAAASGSARVVSFKDAAKLKSWDAWNDHKKQAAVTNILQREKRCVTWERLNAVDPGLREIGRLQTRTSDRIASSAWSVGCETLDRDYGDWNSYKALIPMLGVKHARFFSGWAKTEQEKGVYDFTWLDPQIRECAAMGVKPWICISYGNPVWGSDFRLGMRVKQVTENPEAFAAWLRYTKALVARYKDVVDEWEVWNEPFGQAKEYAELFYATAKAVREVQPTAKCYCTAIDMNRDMSKSDYAVVLEKLKRENALDLGSRFIYHPYAANPDTSYEAGDGQFGWQMALPLRRLVKSYSDSFDIMQGEAGCPGQLEFAHALSDIEWTEYSQAKWNLRRAIGDAVRSIPSNLFTMTDLQYTFMLQSFGLVRSNTLKEFVYRRPSWYAMRNVYSLFDDETLPQEHLEVKAGDRTLSSNRFERDGKPLCVFWFGEAQPSSELAFVSVDLEVPAGIEDPVWVDLITGRVFEIPADKIVRRSDGTTLKGVPMWDSPVLVTTRGALAL